MLGAASIVLAALSWRLVETPMRKTLSAPRFIQIAAASMAVLVVGAGFIDVTNGYKARLPKAALRIAASAKIRDPRNSTCVSRAKRWLPPSEACVYGAAVEPAYALLGDSHADSLAVTLGELAAAKGSSLLFYARAGCRPFVEDKPSAPEPPEKCRAYMREAIERIVADPRIGTVILHGRHSLELYAEGLGRDYASVKKLKPLTPDATKLFAVRVRDTLRKLKKAGKRVVVIAGVPESNRNIPSILARLIISGSKPGLFTIPRHNYDLRDRAVNAIFAKQKGNVDLMVFPARSLCDDRSCLTTDGTNSFYYDDNHLSRSGAEYLAPILAPIFRTE
jgi:hypothetical protein